MNNRAGIWGIVAVSGILFALSDALGAADGAVPQDNSLVIVGAALIDGTGNEPIEHTAVYIKDGLIERIDVISNGEYPDGRNVVPAHGKFLVPGIVDAHSHIDSLGGIALSESQEEIVREYYPRAFLYHGVTSVVNLSAHVPDEVLELRDRVHQTPSFLAPRIYTGAGNFTVNGGWSGRHGGGLDSAAQIDKRLDEYARRGFDLVKIINEDGLGQEAVFEVIPQDYMERIARISGQNGLPVFIHATDEEEFIRAIEVRPRGIVHGLLTPLAPNSPVIGALIENRIYVVPTIVLFEAFFRYRDNPDLLANPLLEASVPDFILQKAGNASVMEESYEKMDTILRMDAAAWAREVLPVLKENTRRMASAGVPIAIGSDSGGAVVHAFQGFNTPREMEIIAACCMTPMETLVAATKAGADMIGAGHEFGTLEVGQSADILVLNESPLEDIGNIRDFDTLILRGNLIDRASLSYRAYLEEKASRTSQ